MAREPIWVARVVVDAIHFDQLRSHGGLSGVRDANAMESALDRPRQWWTSEPGSDFPTLAAAYGFGLCHNHPYQDGNKRVAFVTMVVFLTLNGWAFDAPEAEVVTSMVAVADGNSTEADLAAWLGARSERSKRAKKATRRAD